MFDWNVADLPTFMEWYNSKVGKNHYPHIPRFKKIVYFEHCASGIGIQVDQDTFKEYLQLFKNVDGFNYFYDRVNDCTVYCIDDCPVLRLYYWGCYS